MKVGLFSSIKDEGPFLLEWVAYHRLIGFGPILVYSNNCSDGSDDLLDALARHGVLTHVRQELKDGQIPQHVAADAAFKHEALRDAEWLMWLDTDEFLRVFVGSCLVQSLAQRFPEADGVCVNWRLFGDGGNTAWEPAPTILRHFKRAPDGHSRHVMFKTLFKRSEHIRGFGLHRPFLHASFRTEGNRILVNSNGEPMHDNAYRCGKWKRHALGGMPSELISFESAAIHHYAVRTRDCFELKKLRGQGTRAVSSAAQAPRFNENYWRIYNANQIEDRSMIKYTGQLLAEMEKLSALQGVGSKHSECIAAYRQRLRGISASCAVGDA